MIVALLSAALVALAADPIGPAATASTPPAAIITRFAPPLDRPIRYATRRTVTLDSGAVASFGMVQQLRFQPRDDGFAVTLTPVSADAEGPEAVTGGFLAMMEAFRAIEIRARVAADGTLGDVEDAAETWRALVAAAARGVAPGSAGDLVRGLVAGLAALPESAQAEALLDGPRTILGFAPPLLAPGLSAPFTGQVEAPGGTPVEVTGTVRVVEADGSGVEVRIDAATDGTAMRDAADALRAATATLPAEQRAAAAAAADRLATLRMQERTEVTIDRATGLAERIQRRVVAIASDGTTTELLVERTERLPA